jgi:hypothetical protein
MPTVAIQEIRTIWSKASRGGAAAARRNAVPEAALFPPAGSPSAPAIVRQRQVYGEANDFAEPLESEAVESTSDSISIGCVTIGVSAGRVTVAYEYDYRCGGLPPRHSRPGAGGRDELAVEPGRWVRVRYNGRFSGDVWWYEKVVVNVGLFERPAPDMFVSTEPAEEISRMAELR